MTDPIRKALTKTVQHKIGRGTQQLEIPPNEKLVLGVKFAISMTACLSALEVAHLLVLGKWSSEVFSAITALVGTVTGIFITQKT